MKNINTEVDYVVDFLNRLVRLDAKAITRLVELRTPCNEALAGHPTVQVASFPDGSTNIGVLGLINGLVGAQPDSALKPGWGYIAAVYAENGQIIKFTRIDQ